MRTRANPHNLPPRLYERASAGRITWWAKANDGTTSVVRTLSKPATDEQIRIARAAAVLQHSVKHGRQQRTTPESVNLWVANAGIVEPGVTRMRNGLPIWARHLYLSSKRRARTRKVVWSLSLQQFADIVQRCNGLCEVSGHPLSLTIKGQKGPYGPSIDRIVSSAGYTPDNVRVVCIAVNFALNSWGLDAFLPIARAMVERHSYSKV